MTFFLKTNASYYFANKKRNSIFVLKYIVLQQKLRLERL